MYSMIRKYLNKNIDANDRNRLYIIIKFWSKLSPWAINFKFITKKLIILFLLKINLYMIVN